MKRNEDTSVNEIVLVIERGSHILGLVEHLQLFRSHTHLYSISIESKTFVTELNSSV